MVLNDSPD